MTAALDRFREQRRLDMCARVERAMKTLDAAGHPITFSAVAQAAGVSRQWIYGSPYRAEIEALRTPPTRAGSAPPRPARERPTEASLRNQVDTLRERLREARTENDQLRRELDRALGLLRSTRPEPPSARLRSS